MSDDLKPISDHVANVLEDAFSLKPETKPVLPPPMNLVLHHDNCQMVQGNRVTEEVSMISGSEETLADPAILSYSRQCNCEPAIIKVHLSTLAHIITTHTMYR